MEFDRTQRGYVICTTPRSGSNFLAQLLASTGELGRPLEYFNGPARRVLDHPDFPDDPEAQLHAIPRLGASDNGVYAFKLFITQFDEVAHTHWPLRLPNLSFVRLERRDLLGQAISFARAIQTGQYRSTSPSGGQAVYDGHSIAHCLSLVVGQQARWQAYFAVNNLKPLTIAYEDIVADPAAAVKAVGQLMGLTEPPRIDTALVNLQIQRDAQSEEWRARFLAAHGDVTVPLALDLHNLSDHQTRVRARA